MLYCLVGKSGAGKDTLFKRLEYKKVVGYTTRKRREGEQEGVEYHFVSEKEMNEFKDKGLILEIREYDTVNGKLYYFTLDDEQLVSNEPTFMICSPEQFKSIKERKSDVISILLEMDNGERLIRAIKREHLKDYSEICRRYLSDEESFKNFKADYVIDSSNCFGYKILDKINKIVGDNQGDR